MDEITIGSSQTVTTDMPSTNEVRFATGISSGQIMEEEGTVLDSGIVPFFDTSDGSQIIFKGILDANGSVILDPSFLMGGITIDGIVRDGNFAFTTVAHPFVSTSGASTVGTRPQEHQFDTHHVVQINDEFFTTADLQQKTRSSDQNRALKDKPSVSQQNVIVTLNSNHSMNIREDHQAEMIPSAANGRSSLKIRQNLPVKIGDDVEPPIRKGPHICPDCGKSFLKWPQFKRHKAEHLDEKSFRCSLCSMSFNFENNLTLHTMIHEAEANGSLECKMCPAKFTRMASLRSHVRVHEKEENLVCPECGDEFATEARLQNHIDEHNTPNTKSLFYRCKLCGKSFNQAALLKDHSKEHTAVRNQLKILHPRRRKPVQPKASSSLNHHPSQIQGPLDEADDNTHQPLSKAKQRKDQKKKLNCSVCSKRFEKPSQLSRHMRIHTGEKPFECPHCRRSFNQKCTLESHILSMHDKLKPFVCHLCNSSFSQRGNLKAHVLKVHVPPGNDDKYFKCEECPCVYRRIATLNAHIAKFHTKSHQKTSKPNDGVTSNPASANGPSTASDDTEPIMDLTEPVEMSDSGVQPVSVEQQNAKDTPSQSDNLAPQFPVTDIEMSASTNNATSASPPRIDSNTQISSEEAPVEETTEVSIMHESEGLPKTIQVKVKKVGADKWHLCPFDECSKGFRKPSDLVRHIRVHTQERPYTCDQCGKAFAVKSTLSTHLKTHAEIKDWECRICRKQFSVLNSLKTHERLHTGAKPFQCSQCSKYFRTSSQRRMHMRVHTRNTQGLMAMNGRRVKLLRIGDTHPVQNVNLPDPLKITSDGDLVPVPNRTSGSMLKVSSEVTEESSVASSEWTKSRPYKCSVCPSAFKKSSHLKQHVRSHTGERPYKCFQCYRNFISSGVLKNHIKTHEGVRAHKCTQCQLTFTTNGSLKRHMISVHSELRSFVCPYCHNTFKTSVQCRKHIKTHRNELIQLQSKKDTNQLQGTQTSDSSTKKCLAPELPYPPKEPSIMSTHLTQQDPVDNPSSAELQSQVETSIHTSPSDQGVVINQPHPEGHPNLLETATLTNADQNTDSLQIQDITEMIETERHLPSVSSGDVITQYSLQTSSLGQDSSQQQMSLSMGDGQTFDGPIFTLQNGESIDLTGSLSQIMPSLNSTPLAIPTTSMVTVSDSSRSFTSGPDSALLPNKTVYDITNEAKQLLRNETGQTNQPTNQNNNDSSEISVNVINLGTGSGIDIDNSNIVAMSIVTDETAQDKGKVNVCSTCGRGFKKRSDLLRHFRIHTGEKPFKCHICGKAFRVKSTRESHLRTHEGGKSVSCHVCNNMFSTKSSLNVHLRLHTGIKPYKCPHCDKHFRTSGHRKAHQQWHIKAAKQASKSQSITSQQNQNQSLLPPVQTIRDKSGSNRNLVNHAGVGTSDIRQENHSVEGEMITEDVLIDQSAVANHGNGTSICYVTSGGTDGTGMLTGTTDPVQIVGSLQLTLDSGMPNVQITGLDLNTLQLSDDFLQSLGNVIFMTQPNHSHSGSNQNDPLTGSMVGQTISVLTGKDLNIGSTAIAGSSHATAFGDLESVTVSSEQVHGFTSNNSPMLSSVVQEHKHLSSSLDKNVGIPSNKHCSVCGKNFAKPSLLKRHMTTHTGEKPFKCKECGCAFNQKNSLDVHMFTHGDEDERPFACSLCPFRTVLKTALKKHCLRAHKGVWNESMIAAAPTPISTNKTPSVPVST